MADPTPSIAASAPWMALQAHSDGMRAMHLRTLFKDDPARAERMSLEAAGLFLDYSKNRATAETMTLLLALANLAGVRAKVDAMFRGDIINTTENRPVLHVALRSPRGAVITVNGENVVDNVHAVLDRMSAFADRIRSGAWTGHTGRRIRNIVNIGIGGSDLGPAMAYEALRHYSDRSMTFRFVSNVDATDLVEATRDLDRGGNALHRVVEDVHHAGDDDQRTQRADVAAGEARRQ